MNSTVFAVANNAMTAINKNAFEPITVATTSAKGAVDWLSNCQSTTLTTVTATSMYNIVDIMIDRINAFGIVFVGFFVSSPSLVISSNPRYAKNIKAAAANMFAN